MPAPAEKTLAKLDENFSAFDDAQCFYGTADGRLELVQTSSADGLPWPPDYKPLRDRFPGN
jgi:hypothetical protein